MFTIQEYKRGLIPLSALIEFLRKIDQEVIPPISSRTQIEEYIQKILTNGIMLIAMHGDSLLGLCGFYCNDYKSKVAFLTTIGVSPSCRNKGVASLLIKEAIANAREHGMQTMRLETSPYNIKAQSLYKKHGFSEYKHPVGVNGQPSSIILECKLVDTE